MILLVRRLGGVGREQRVRMHLRERKVAEDEAQVVAQLVLGRLDDEVGKPAMRAFEVAELDQCDGSVGRSLRVVLRPAVPPVA
jgi:hypothetical protein